jgi:hypothetical protein
MPILTLAMLNDDARAQLKQLRETLWEQADALTVLLERETANAPEAVQTLLEKGNMLGEWAVKGEGLPLILHCILGGNCLACVMGDPCEKHPLPEEGEEVNA